MREPKFRGLNKKGEFVYGSLVTTNAFIRHMPKQHTKTWIIQSAFGNGGWFSVMQRQYVKPETVGQFTGLIDKKGVEIFEGDIIKQHLEWSGGYYSDEFGEIEFIGVAKITASKGVVLNQCKSRDLIDCDEFSKHKWTINVRGYRCEVIGNIHQNPELLESVK